MPYCPHCFIEYVEGTTQCEDCGAVLLPGSPPEAPPALDLSGEKDVKLIPVRVFTGGTAQMDAEVAQSILGSQRIPCVLSGEGSAELIPVLDVQLLVREEDAVRAGHVLRDYLDTVTPTGTEDPDTNEEE
jgi:Putative prokaryotic signal transducing protein